MVTIPVSMYQTVVTNIPGLGEAVPVTMEAICTDSNGHPTTIATGPVHDPSVAMQTIHLADASGVRDAHSVKILVNGQSKADARKI